MQKTVPLEAGKFYHVFTRGNNKETVFRCQTDYYYFLQLYQKYISQYANTYAYCLLPNHVHFLIQVKDAEDLMWRDETGQAQSKIVNVQKQFSHLLNAYAKSFNAANNRIGSLFQNRFGRKEVTSASYFTRLVFYIHFNPQYHGLLDDFTDWPYSSYHSLLSKKPTNLQRESVLDWFGGQGWFKTFHQNNTAEFKSIASFLAEDDF